MQERLCPSCGEELGQTWGRCQACGARFSELMAAVSRRDMRLVVLVISLLAMGIFGIFLALGAGK